MQHHAPLEQSHSLAGRLKRKVQVRFKTANLKGKHSDREDIMSRCYVYLEESSTEGFEDTLGQCGLCAVSEGAGQKQRGLLLNGRVLIVHHTQDVL